MALMGKGVLAIWNGIAPEAEQEFVSWHVSEHIPERVGLPGFLRGRRYVAERGHPRYFNFYEVDSPETLAGRGYLDRLNAPTPWTRKVVAHFQDTSRTVCDVVESRGLGEGAWLETLRMNAHDDDAFQGALASAVLPALASDPGICGIHLLRGRTPSAAPATAEAELRKKPDDTIAWLLLIEAVDETNLTAAAAAAGSDAGIAACGAAGLVRGRYRLQYSLTHADVTR